MSPSLLPVLFRRAVRRQRRSPGAAALIVATLALALGANTAMFSIADGLLLRAVPFRDAGQLVAVTSAFPTIRLAAMNLSGPEVEELRQLTTSFAAVGPYTFAGLVVEGGSEAELAEGIQISNAAMTAFGLWPATGRRFAAAEYARGANVVLLGDGLWRRAFGADPRIVGRVVRLGGVAREVIGVMPPGISVMNRRVDVWLPLTTAQDDLGSRSDHRFNVVGRLAAGRSLADARADVAHAMDVWRVETGEMHTPHPRMHPLELQPLARATTGLNREPIGALVAAVGFVLLIACANISNLLVARSEGRRADIAVHLALGATRRQLAGEFVCEGLLLAAAGGLGGLLISRALIDAVQAIWPAAAVVELHLDVRVLGAAAALAALAGISIGILPVLRLDARRAAEALQSGSRGSAGPGRLHIQQALIGLQVAMAVLLAGGAGLMVRSLMAITAIDGGIEVDRVLRAQISLPAGSYAEDAQVWSFYDRLLQNVRTKAGVTQAAIMSGLPPQRRANNTSFLLDGVETMDHSSIHQVDFVQHVSSGYLQVLGIPVREGRELGAADDERGAPVALVNETLARSFWPNDSALGHRLKPAGNIGTWFTIVGVVADVRQNGIQSPAGTEIYVTHRQARMLMSGFMPRAMNLLVKSAEEVPSTAAGLRAAVREIDPGAAVSGIAPMQTVIDRTIAQPRMLAWTFTAFAVLALSVAGMGVYAVTSCAVGTRTAEFGVRMALGARPLDVVRLVLTGGLWTIAAGAVAGSVASVFTARLLRNLLFRIEPLDAPSLATGALFITVIALVATLLPARRAARVDPWTALRD